MTLKTLNDIFADQLKDICSAEKQLVAALPKVAEAASDPELKTTFQQHLQITQTHVDKVQALLAQLNLNSGNKKCKAMEGLIEETNELLKQKGDAEAIDAGLIAAAQKIEHYEIATYGSLRAWAQTLENADHAQVLQSILDEEHEANDLLTELAENHINTQASA